MYMGLICGMIKNSIHICRLLVKYYCRLCAYKKPMRGFGFDMSNKKIPISDLEQNPAKKPEIYVNRELSWLKFNERVLEESKDDRNPLLERLNFAAIFQSNLDEFFMVRVGTLMDSLEDGVTDDKTGMTSAQQIDSILARTKDLLADRDLSYKRIMRELSGFGVELCRFDSLQDKTQAYLEKYFMSDVMPILSPQIVGRKQPFPFLRNKEIYAVALLRTKNGGNSMGIVPCGDNALRRLVPLQEEGLRFVLMEDLILHFLPKIFEHYKIDNTALIRMVRSADISIDESSDADDMSAEDYRKSMEKLISRRKKLNPVKLEYKGKMDADIESRLCKYLNLSKKHIFASSIPLDLSFSGFLRDVLRDKNELFYQRRVPQNSVNVDLSKPMISQIRHRDILLAYPYESIRPFLRLLQEAGQDPKVVSIKMTLYRVAVNSKIVEALVDAVENGKEVVVLVELRARFDEENNIGWSRVLEQAGCRVIYGLDRMKVHSKLTLITRVHGEQVEYITQVGTGNYNEDTVRLYTDFSLMTASHEIGAEAARVFNCLSLGEVIEDTKNLLVAPACLRSRIIEMIDDEINRAASGQEAYLGFKLNGLTDKGIIDKLIEASQNGVHVDLLVRGMCCLVGGIPGKTENIHVYSIVGRYLEHARIYIFGTQGRRSVYISSADFMTRNTMRRVEVAAPLYDDDIRHRVEQMFFDQLRDNVKLRMQRADGKYVYKTDGDEPFCSQEYFIEEAYNGAWAVAPEEKTADKAETEAPDNEKGNEPVVNIVEIDQPVEKIEVQINAQVKPVEEEERADKQEETDIDSTKTELRPQVRVVPGKSYSGGIRGVLRRIFGK